MLTLRISSTIADVLRNAWPIFHSAILLNELFQTFVLIEENRCDSGDHPSIDLYFVFGPFPVRFLPRCVSFDDRKIFFVIGFVVRHTTPTVTLTKMRKTVLKQWNSDEVLTWETSSCSTLNRRIWKTKRRDAMMIEQWIVSFFPSLIRSCEHWTKTRPVEFIRRTKQRTNSFLFFRRLSISKSRCVASISRTGAVRDHLLDFIFKSVIGKRKEMCEKKANSKTWLCRSSCEWNRCSWIGRGVVDRIWRRVDNNLPRICWFQCHYHIAANGIRHWWENLKEIDIRLWKIPMN